MFWRAGVNHDQRQLRAGCIFQRVLNGGTGVGVVCFAGAYFIDGWAVEAVHRMNGEAVDHALLVVGNDFQLVWARGERVGHDDGDKAV